MTFLNKSTDTEVTKLDTAFAVHEHIIELDIPVQHAPAVAVTQRVEDLLKDCLCTLFIKPLTLFDILKQITPT